MSSVLRDNGLTIALTALFSVSAVGMILTGYRTHSEELIEHGAAAMSLTDYVATGHFLSALFENWESEFLQMAIYVILTAFLFQRGSAESRDPDDPGRSNDELSDEARRRTPILAWLYSYSLGISLALLFVISLGLHWWASWQAANDNALLHDAPLQSAVEHLFGSTFWFESLQNWQSEFQSTAALVVLSIFLRHKGSPESKPVGATNAETGA